MSPVAGFEAARAAFIADLRARGASVMSAAAVTQELQENAA